MFREIKVAKRLPTGVVPQNLLVLNYVVLFSIVFRTKQFAKAIIVALPHTVFSSVSVVLFS